jgi:putative ABC transport system ATP-binding protein
MSDSSLILLQDIRKDYPMGEVTVHALSGMNLDVKRGEFIVLLGPSGSGKTTTLNLIGGLDRPSGGKLEVEGTEITGFNETRLAEYRRRSIGFIFQFFNLIPTLTAVENVEFALALTHGGRPMRAQGLEFLARVGLRDRADHFPSQLSGGEQQRVAIARALANRPPLLLADEPTGNLDADTGRQVLQSLRDLNKQDGATVVLVTHNTSIAPMADRVVRLHDGAVRTIDVNRSPAAVAELAW